MKTPFTKQLLKPLFFLAVFTIVCAFLARTLTDSETLSDYAAKKAESAEPETAYEETEPHIDESETDAFEKKEPSMDPIDKNSENEDLRDNAIDDVSAADTDNTPTEADDTSDIGVTDAAMNNISDIPADRTVYQEGFYYESLTDEVKTLITGISYPVSAADASALSTPAINILEEGTTPAVSYDDLRYLSVLYYDFNGEVQTGELICNKRIAQDLVEIFYELYQNEYQIEKIRLIDEYQGDDTASMTDNNTSCFNYRVVDGTSSLSKHALGCAIDINPFYNPYVVFNKGANGETYISPAGSEIYADRSQEFPYKIDENDLCYKLFKEHGFVWGGNWNSCKDYQHFQKVPD